MTDLTMTTEPIEQESFEDVFTKIANDVQEVHSLLKTVRLNFKELSKVHKYEVKMYKTMKKTKSNRLSGFNKPTEVPAPLQKLLKLSPDEKLPRTQITKLIYEYIKQNNLQSATDKRTINPNKELQKLFGLEKNEQLSFYNIQTHMKKIYQTKNDNVVKA